MKRDLLHRITVGLALAGLILAACEPSETQAPASTEALARCGTVPCPPSEQAFLLPPGETPTQPGACGPGQLKDTATFPDDVTRQLDVAPGYVKLGNATGVASITAAVVDPSQLPESPLTWELLACGIRTTATSPTGDPVVLFHGPAQKVCFNIPGGYSKYKISYYDPTPTIARWVGLSTVVDSVQNVACTSPTFRLPALFALFGQL